MVSGDDIISRAIGDREHCILHYGDEYRVDEERQSCIFTSLPSSLWFSTSPTRNILGVMVLQPFSFLYNRTWAQRVIFVERNGSQAS
ncbi:hypothetical protein GJ744_000478 [Endocarpon pusillum]|uniref:Uncharacterized protein n=1 Tax=Endocarpon pusillum TaxID=364733 RepID=A0A8H7ADE8_9EURO|nr:hypothetical protein GJ744_000478 [Endocarpon pusillum]